MKKQVSYQLHEEVVKELRDYAFYSETTKNKIVEEALKLLFATRPLNIQKEEKING